MVWLGRSSKNGATEATGAIGPVGRAIAGPVVLLAAARTADVTHREDT
jgi:hypothetical protein